ncbi:MAG: 4Fe-4S binding protein [Acidobacteria bacterium]|nr:4Fe-4S binding protein [Acidobacteriota bacterium]
MSTRNIIKIDEEKCDGCGLCVTACAEGAIRIVDGKAKVVGESLCDGLGACLGHCPQGALTIEQREAPDFDPVAVERHLAGEAAPAASACPSAAHARPFHPAGGITGHGCPGSAARTLTRTAPSAADLAVAPPAVSRLENWPVQLHLVPVRAEHLQGADLVIAADCAPFAYPDFHRSFLGGKTLLIGCPKLDDTGAYLDKLTRMFAGNALQSIHVVHMEVPCCFGLVRLVADAVRASGRPVPVKVTKISLGGEILEQAVTHPLPQGA